MKKILILSILFGTVFYSCEDKSIDASLIKNRNYEEYVHRNYPDLPIDTIKYNFENDTLTAIGYIYETVNQKKIILKKDTQSYYFKTEGSSLILYNIDINDLKPISELTNYLGITKYSKWNITKLAKDKVELDFTNYKEEIIGHIELFGVK